MLEKHHVWGGRANRPISERHGFWVMLNHYWHNEPPCDQNDWEGSVHYTREIRLQLQRECQMKYEETHSRAEFMALIGKSFI